MTLEEWRKQFIKNGTPIFVPKPEVNLGADMCTPKTSTPLDSRVSQEPAPAQFDGITIKDMQDADFLQAIQGANKFIRRDAAIRYNRNIGTKFEQAKFLSKLPKK